MDPTFLSARRIADLARARAIGCLELLDHFIARIERLDPRINAVVVRDFDRARDRARALDASADRSAPLFGVPMTIKESCDVAGLPTTWGVPEMRGSIASTNAVAVDRLLAAGAVMFGKTNVPLMLNDLQTFNELYGTTNNPWDLTRSPGGSSGGSAAALAAGPTGLEVGTDLGSSIRNPAHYCGVFGHKPTWGICPLLGHALSGRAPYSDIARHECYAGCSRWGGPFGQRRSKLHERNGRYRVLRAPSRPPSQKRGPELVAK
jgi:amidase